MYGPQSSLPLPPGLPPDRVWLPASTRPEALEALEALRQAITDGPVPPPSPDQDRC